MFLSGELQRNRICIIITGEEISGSLACDGYGSFISGLFGCPPVTSFSQNVGLEYDPTNYLLMHAMGPNVAGVIGSAVAAGILLGFLG